jgi:phosphoadenosine phosphosulfate reductase
MPTDAWSARRAKLTTMHVTMVKKRLANGEPCRKCVQAEELLKARGLWSLIDEVVWADENDPSSPGMRLGARLGVGLAPFFVVREGGANDAGTETVYESVLQFVKERLEGARGAGHAAAAGSAGAVAGDAGPPETVDVEGAARELADQPPSAILRWGLERWGGALGIAFSGAEDVVLVHMASELGLPFSVFCLDTGRLHPETYRFIDAVRKRYKIEIHLMSPEAAPLQALVKTKGLFSFYDDGHEECCGVRKVEPLRRKLATLRAWATGQRRDQSPATRGDIAVVERDKTFPGLGGSGTLIKLNPLARWSSADTWGFIRENGIPHNSLHERGFVSIGCEPCTRAVLPGEHERAGRWWWEESTKRECGLHIGNVAPPRR